MSDTRIVELSGFEFTVRYATSEEILKECGPDSYGCCSHPADDNPEILVWDRLKGKKLIEIIIHEMMHGAFPQVAESVIKKNSREMANVIWEKGFRQK